MEIYTSNFCGLPVVTGDIICTRDGDENSLLGKFWKLLGRLVPGEVDHCLLYLGPGGRCVESGPAGVIVFEMPPGIWDSAPLLPRRLFLDTYYTTGDPISRRGLNPQWEKRARKDAAAYCLHQAAHSKPYNLNFFNPQKDGAFYCSQLIYKAYLAGGIDLLSTPFPPADPLARIVFPQDILNSVTRRQSAG